jgi:acylpyruvate hydrolase
MKLVTFSQKGTVGLGALIGTRVVDLSRAYVAALTSRGNTDELVVAERRVPRDLVGLLRGGAASLAAARLALAFVRTHSDTGLTENLWHPLGEVELLPPVPRPGKVVCVGLNYRSHLAEIGETVPKYPILFTKLSTSLTGHQRPIILPRISTQVDYEGELAVVIGRRGKHISAADALAYVAGFTCANDVSAHDLEFRTSQWTSGKMLDTFCPLGPVVTTLDEFTDPNSLLLKTTLNGRTVQECRTTDMVFRVPDLVSYVSELATLEPGDLILTGTPAGIGCNRKPQVFLRPGDQISVTIEGIGTLTNPVLAEPGN